MMAHAGATHWIVVVVMVHWWCMYAVHGCWAHPPGHSAYMGTHPGVHMLVSFGTRMNQTFHMQGAHVSRHVRHHVRTDGARKAHIGRETVGAKAHVRGHAED